MRMYNFPYYYYTIILKYIYIVRVIKLYRNIYEI